MNLTELIAFLRENLGPDFAIAAGDYVDNPEWFPMYLVWLADQTATSKVITVFEPTEHTLKHFEALNPTDKPTLKPNNLFLLVMCGGFFHFPNTLSPAEALRTVNNVLANNRTCNICREDHDYLQGCTCSIKICIHCELEMLIEAIDSKRMSISCPQCRATLEHFPITVGLQGETDAERVCGAMREEMLKRLDVMGKCAMLSAGEVEAYQGRFL